jgi:hypothetical protein
LLANQLDFGAVWSGTATRKIGAMLMNAAAINEAIQVCLKEICSKLDEASRLARAADACVLAGSVAEGIEVSMDIEQLIYEAGRLHDAVSLMHRLTRV